MAAKCKSKEMVLVGTKVKGFIRSKEMMCSAEVLEALNCCVYCCLEKAVQRAKDNGRKTVQAKDI